jgi:hypothetical protein
VTQANARNRAAAAGFALSSAAVLCAYALGVEPYRLQVARITLRPRRLPPALDGLSVLLLADLHMEKWGRRERLLADLLDSLPDPDIAVLAGDLLQGANGLASTSELIERHVRARAGIFGLWGNAEHKLNRAMRAHFRARLEQAGVRVLVNENRSLALCGETITIAGTDDPYFGHANLAQTLSGRDPNRFCLLVAHSPQLALLAARAGNVDLMLSGHTHGGQVRLPLIGALKTQNPLSRKIDQGVFDRDRFRAVLGARYPADSEMLLYVTRGVGVARFRALPLYPRFLCPPEVTWITLKSPAAP